MPFTIPRLPSSVILKYVDTSILEACFFLILHYRQPHLVNNKTSTRRGWLIYLNINVRFFILLFQLS